MNWCVVCVVCVVCCVLCVCVCWCVWCVCVLCCVLCVCVCITPPLKTPTTTATQTDTILSILPTTSGPVDQHSQNLLENQIYQPITSFDNEFSIVLKNVRQLSLDSPSFSRARAMAGVCCVVLCVFVFFVFVYRIFVISTHKIHTNHVTHAHAKHTQHTRTHNTHTQHTHTHNTHTHTHTTQHTHTTHKIHTNHTSHTHTHTTEAAGAAVCCRVECYLALGADLLCEPQVCGVCSDVVLWRVCFVL